MPHMENDRIVESKTEARAGVTGHNVRYVLLIGTLAVSQVGPGAENAVELTWLATTRTVRVSLATPGSVEVLAQDGPVEPDLQDPDPTGIDVRARHQRAFDRFMADVYGTIAGGSSSRFATFADGLHAAAITEAVIESSASGRWVEVAS